MPSVTVVTTTATSISLTWSVPSGSVVSSYEVMWQRDTSVGCSDEDEDSRTINTNSISTAYTISGLEEDSLYRITVTAVNSIANIISDTVTAMTEEAGERDIAIFQLVMSYCICTSSSVCCSHSYEPRKYHLQHHCPVGGSELH